MAKISDTTSYPNITPVADDYLILTDYNSSLATKTVTVDALSGYLFGNISVSLIPSIDCTYDIGSVTKKWRNLYLCGTASVNILTATTGTFATSFTSNGTTVLNGALSGTSLITSTTLAGASNTNIASTLAIKTYIEAGDDLGGSYDTSTTSVNIPTQSLRILGTANQITTTGDGAQTMQIAFPTNITTPGQLNSGGAIFPTANATYNLGGSALKWNNLFVTGIADENNSTGTALQFLRKSATNSGLEWAAVASGSTLGVRLTSSATPTFTVDLATQDLGIVGTTNEIEVSNSATRTAVLRLPTNITTRGQINSLGPIIATTDKTQNLGGSVTRWRNFFTEGIADGGNNLGTANQVLAKNAANTELEWQTIAAGGSMSNFKISDSETPPNVTVINNADSIIFAGTTNQLSVIENSGTLTFSFPTNITTPGQLNSGGAILPTVDASFNLGGTAARWQNFFTEGIADGANSVGAAGQVLAKNAANTALEWQTQAGGGSMNSWEFSDGTTAQTISNGNTATIAGTINEVEVAQSGGTATLRLPTNITTRGQINSLGPIIATTDKTQNLGGSVTRWRNFFTEGIADGQNNLGTAGQVLGKNAANTELEWVTQSGGGSMTSFSITDGAAPQTVSDSDVITFAGTANQLVATTTATDTVTYSFPTNITTPGQLNSGGAILPTSDKTFNFGGTTDRWLNGFFDGLADGANSVGTAGQVLGKNAGNTALEWLTPATGTMSSWILSDGTTPETISNGNTATFSGTANEIELAQSGGTVTYRLPTNITTRGQINSLGPIIATTDKTQNLGSSVTRWLNFFTDGIADGGNNLGTAGQVLAKNSANTELEWQTQAGGGSMNSWEFSDGTTAQTISNGQTAIILGTANETDVVQLNGTATLRLPVNITTRGQLNSLGPILPTTTASQNLGGSALKWNNLFVTGIADGANSVGTANQVLAKNAANTELEWVAQSGGGSMTSFSITDGANPQTVSDSDVITFAGTANQLVATTTATDTVTFSFPTNITTPGQLNSGGAILPTASASFNLGGTTDRWLNGFFEGLADGANSVGAAGQVLGKNAGNTALEWLTPTTGTMSNWILSDGSTTHSVGAGGTAIFSGTTNEITTSQSLGTVTIALPTNITTKGQLNSLGPIIATTDKTQNLGSSVNRWLNLFTDGVADGGNNLGTANQVLAKNAANTELEWQTISVTGMSSFNFNTEAVTNGDSLVVEGTVNEVELSTTGLTTTLRLPTNITTRGQINSLGPIIPTTDKTQSLGSSVTRWLNFFTDGIADGGNNLGTANQVLAKNAANTELEWVDSSSEYLEVTVTVSNAAMKTLNASPITLITAPGAGKVIVLDSCLLYLNYVAPAFNFAADLFISYIGSTATQFRPFGDIQSNIINSSSATYQSLSKVITDNTSNGQCRINEGIKFGGPNTGSGGGEVRIKLRYRIEDLS